MAGFDDPTKMKLAETLGQKMIPIVDGIRNLSTKFGMRPYKVRIVKVRWSDGKRGRGVPYVLAEEDLLPIPLVQDLVTLTEIVSPIGLEETGAIVVSEISGRYTEDQLRFLDSDGTPLAPDEEVFYEIEFPQLKRLTEESVKRRFFLRGAPFYAAGRFQWSLRLEKAHEDRSRTGDPR